MRLPADGPLHKVPSCGCIVYALCSAVGFGDVKKGADSC
jgi:hypothetical protein